jgi:hypothetical protein
VLCIFERGRGSFPSQCILSAVPFSLHKSIVQWFFNSLPLSHWVTLGTSPSLLQMAAIASRFVSFFYFTSRVPFW